MKKNLFFMIAVLAAGYVSAAPVSGERAAKVARNFWMAKVGDKRADVLVDRTAEWAYDGIKLFTAPGGGFVLVSADDAATPILGFSSSSTLNPADLSDNLRYWLQGYQDQVEVLRSLGAEATPTIAENWALLESGKWKGTKEGGSVEPMFTVLWSQDAPFNDLCPGNEADSTKAVTGCAATAQAMLMKFWNHPTIGLGQSSYNCTNYGILSANYGNTLYDWEHMVDNPTPVSPDVEKRAVAQLMAHVGISLQMMYSPTGSGARGFGTGTGSDYSLTTYFRYRSDMRVETRAMYTSAQWLDLIVAELQEGRPILYEGTDQTAGHAFICDGYDDETKYVHFNFGWRGNGNGFYSIDSISPLVGGVGGNATYTFNLNNDALFNVQPDYSSSLGEEYKYFYGAETLDSVLYAINDTLDAPWTAVSNADWLTIEHNGFARAGYVKIRAAENNTGEERFAEVVFTQGSERKVLHIMQGCFSPEDYCEMTIEMRSTGYPGWLNGAYVAFESPAGYIYDAVQLQHGVSQTDTVLVAPADVHVVFHRGGSSDRFIAYKVMNQYGEVVVETENAAESPEDVLVSWPCAHVGIADAEEAGFSVSPNPATDMLRIEAEGLEMVEMLDMNGRVCGQWKATSGATTVDVSALPRGFYMVRMVTDRGVKTSKIVKA